MASVLTTPPYLRDGAWYDLGSSRQILDTKCETHLKLITQSLDVNLDSDQLAKAVIAGVDGADNIFIYGNTESESYFSGRLRLYPTSRYDPASWGKLVDHHWIDHNLPRRWKWKCDQAHTCSSTHKLGHLASERPLWVVDTWLQCLVPCSPSITYVALSYVWGGITNFRTLKENLDQLQKPSSLAEGNTYPPISTTIRHAMSLVERLGERYLWVDILCIVQNDKAQKYADIAKMAAIYANASVTIIASDGVDANYGLRGLRGISLPRSVKQVVHSLTRNVAAIETLETREYTVWDTRGWTLQESLFSRRRIIFEHGWIRWECQCAIWQESSDANDLFEYKPGIFTIAKEVPDIMELDDIIINYNRRELTFPEDVLFAFSGISSVLSRTYHGFISGLPMLLFHISILWIPLASLRRRTSGSSGVNSCFPSWSWAGWKGGIWGWRTLAVDFVKKYSPRDSAVSSKERVFPLAQWSWLRTQNGTRTFIQDTWFAYKNKFWNNLTAPCPTGWTRHHIMDSIYSWEAATQPELQTTPLCFYTHESETEAEFWYPLPSLGPDQPAETHIFAPFISCKTRRGWLVAGETLPLSRGGSWLSLRDRAGNWTGILCPHEPFNRDVVRNSYDEVSIELVEVATGRVIEEGGDWPLCFEEQGLDERPNSGTFYEYYYVLWIEWKDGIAYRIGIGRVEKNAWERQEREWIDLVLG